MGSVPAESVLRDSKGENIEKLCGQSEWQPRSICVTEDKLLIIHPDHATEIADQIPLVPLLTLSVCLFCLIVSPLISKR